MSESRERAVKGVVRYDGTNFAGWQVQPDRRTVQGELEDALARILSRPVRVHGAARTDAGVHALGQVFSVKLPEHVDLEKMRRALSGLLRPDARVEALAWGPPDFHARFDARGKTYGYTLQFGRASDPFSWRYAWRIPWPVDLEYLARLATQLAGTRDFAGFQCAGASVETTVRTLHRVEVLKGGVAGPVDAADLWRIEFTGDGFLYKMVRNMVGTLIDAARGHTPASRIDELLAAPSPFRGYTAPAHGLTLLRVYYAEDLSGYLASR